MLNFFIFRFVEKLESMIAATQPNAAFAYALAAMLVGILIIEVSSMEFIATRSIDASGIPIVIPTEARTQYSKRVISQTSSTLKPSTRKVANSRCRSESEIVAVL